MQSWASKQAQAVVRGGRGHRLIYIGGRGRGGEGQKDLGDQGGAAEAGGEIDGPEEDLMCVDVVDAEKEDAKRAVHVGMRDHCWCDYQILFSVKLCLYWMVNVIGELLKYSWDLVSACCWRRKWLQMAHLQNFFA